MRTYRHRFYRALAAGICLLFVIWALSGCSSSSKKRRKRGTVLVDASEKDVPGWVTDIPEERKYYYYVGTSGDTAGFDEGKKAAVADAMSQVVSTIGITATSSTSYEEEYYAEQYQVTLESELLTEGKAKLQDAELKEIYYEQYEREDGSGFYRIYVLLKYSKDDITTEQERLAEIIRMKYGEVGRFEQLAAEHTADGMLMDGVFAHINASSAALMLDDGDVFFERNLIRAASLLQKLRLEKRGEEQTGYVGKPLDRPLELRVFYSEDGREVPVPNVPVKFAYRVPKARTAGYKIEVYRDVTNDSGIASLKIDTVHEVSDKNRVDASLDLEPLMGKLDEAPSKWTGSVDTLEEVIKTKRTVYLFKSDTKAREIRTGIYFIQIDENGELMNKPVTAPAVYEILYSKYFTVRELDVSPGEEEEVRKRLSKAAGKSIERILLGTVRVIEFDSISGFDTAKVSAEVTLYDRESGDTIRTWSIQRSGTGNSKEAARRNALTETGRSLGEILSNTMP